MAESGQLRGLEFTAPEDSHVEKVTASAADGTLSVKFKNSSRVYTHVVGDQALKMFEAWREFPSAGTYYHRFVKRFPQARKSDKIPT